MKKINMPAKGWSALGGKKYLVLGALLLSLVAIPVFAQSTITAEQIIQALTANPTLLAQLRSLLLGGNNIIPPCGSYSFGQDLYVGKSGNDVANLQDALAKEGFDDGIGHDADEEAADRFGENTAANVVQFQKKYGIKQTGYVGPLTRAKLNSITSCPPPAATITCSRADLNADGAVNDSDVSFVQNNLGCSVSAGATNCVKANVNVDGAVNNFDILAVRGKIGCSPIVGQAPVISGVSGPTNLQVGQMGTWTVNASSPTGGDLRYTVNWGDDLYYTSGTNTGTLSSSATFTHIYSRSGVFQPAFTVYNSSSQSARTSISVNVGKTNQVETSVSIKPGSNLALRYDSANQEAFLVANFSVSVTADNNGAISFSKNGAFGVVAKSSQHSSGGSVVAVSSSAVTGDTADQFLVSAGTTRDFNITANFNVLQMFAGVYNAQVAGFYVSSNNQYLNLSGQSNNQTNSVVIVGEKSPYITSVQTGSESGVFGVAGERLSQVTQLVVANYQGGMVTVNKSDFSVSTDGAIEVSLSKLNRPAGSYYVYLVSPTGDSNKMGFTMGGVTNASITVLSPNGGENLELGKTYRIRWSTNGYPNTANVQLGLYDTRYSTEGGAYPEITIANQPNWGFYDWTVPANLNRDFGGSVTTAYHKIKAYIGSGGTSGFDESDNGFSFRQADLPKITVLSPNGGESYNPSVEEVSNQYIRIQYQSANIVGKSLVAYLYSPIWGNVQSVSATASNSGTINMSLIKGGPPSSGQYKINLCASNVDSSPDGKSLCDLSNSYFTITSAVTPPPATTYTVTANPGFGGQITISPMKASYTPGESIKVTAQPNSGYKLASWTGYAANVQPSVTELNLVVSQNMTIGATFAANTVVPPPPTTYSSYKFQTWVSNSSQKVAGATVQITGSGANQTLTTGADGLTTTGINLTAGSTYTYTITASGYNTYTGTVTAVTSSSLTTINVVMQPSTVVPPVTATNPVLNTADASWCNGANPSVKLVWTSNGSNSNYVDIMKVGDSKWWNKNTGMSTYFTAVSGTPATDAGPNIVSPLVLTPGQQYTVSINGLKNGVSYKSNAMTFTAKNCGVSNASWLSSMLGGIGALFN